MHRNVTAIYRTYATADLVRRKLAELGISWDDMHVIPERDEPVGTDGGREGSRYSDQLHDLHLPDDDVETYQHSVRRGDYVVSAEVDEDQVERVQSIMSRPEEEAHNLDKRSEEFRGAGIDPYSDPNSRRTNPDVLARRVPGRTDPYTRSYSRDARLERRLD